MNRVQTIRRIVTAATDPSQVQSVRERQPGQLRVAMTTCDGQRAASAALAAHCYDATDWGRFITVRGWNPDALAARRDKLEAARAALASGHADTAAAAIDLYLTALAQDGASEDAAEQTALSLTTDRLHAAAHLTGVHAKPCLDWPLEERLRRLLFAVKAAEGNLHLWCADHLQVAADAVALFRIEQGERPDRDARAAAVSGALLIPGPASAHRTAHPTAPDPERETM